MDCELYAAELSFDALYASMGQRPVYQPLPKFPAVTRDIAVVCDRTYRWRIWRPASARAPRVF
ncbi:MAG: hypothetical protein V8R55_12935 [Dysosmobacter sp.]